MFRVTKVDENRLNIEYEGALNSYDMELALDEFIQQAQGIENGTMLYVIGDFQFPSLSAIGVKLSKLPSLFGLIGKFNKAAIVTDKKWLQKVSEIEGWFIPGLQIKAFCTEDRLAAEQWLNST